MKESYLIPVNFTITYTMSVIARNETAAKEKAEKNATELFEDDLNEGLLGTSDFACEAQDPI